MIAKSSLPILTIILMASHSAAELEEVSFTAWSNKDCSTDTSNAFTEDSSKIKTWKSTSKTINCAANWIDWGSWPQENGKYTAFIESGPIEENCQLIFYTGPPDDNHGKDSPCFIPYRTLDSSSGCASVSIPTKYGLVYCCGDDCGGPLPSNPGKREEEADVRSRDVTEIKRASLLKRLQGQQGKRGEDGGCTFHQAPGSVVETHYEKPKKSSATVNCAPNAHFDCGISGEYSTSATISHSDSQSNSVSIGASGGNAFFSISGSYGHEWTSTDETSTSTSFSRSYSLSVGPGSSGYLIFTPKTLCGSGTFEGDACDDTLKVGEQTWCIPALVNGVNGTMPDGEWSILQIS